MDSFLPLFSPTLPRRSLFLQTEINLSLQDPSSWNYFSFWLSVDLPLQLSLPPAGMHGQKKILEDRRGTRENASRGGEESDATQKPLATALLQEFQQLKDKFKSEDGEGDKGKFLPILIAYSSYFPLDRVTLSTS